MKTLFNKRKRLAQRGDTIVEVLIATAVVGMVIATSASFSNRTFKQVQGAQERTEAAQLLQGQVDMLRSAMSTNRADDYLDTTANKAFCIDPSAPNNGPVDLTGINNPTLKDKDADDLSSPNPYPAVCTSGRYFLSVEKPEDNQEPYVFHARWEGPNGTRDEVTYYYRIHKLAAISVPPAAVPPPVVPPAGCPLSSSVTYTFDPGGPKDNFRSDNNRISGPAGVEPQRLGPFGLSLPAGGIPAWNDYTVTLRSYDTHDLFVPDTDKQERWHMILRDASGNTTYTSPNSDDVPTILVDGVRQGPPDVFTGQTIADGSVSIIAEHIGIAGNGFHVDSATISCP